MADLKVNIGGGVELMNPVMTASGTFGYGTEFDDFIDVNLLGGYVIKGTTLEHREGNRYPRMAETSSGMLNAVGLQNKGVDYFISNINPGLVKYNKSKLFVNVSGSKIEDYIETAYRLADIPNITGIELNISCPNVKEGGMAFGTSCP
jgi:dihydroorotate dehydrogenase (NAD+) catalytic subunit